MNPHSNKKNSLATDSKDAEIALLNAQKKQLTAQLRELKRLGRIVFRLIGILRNVDDSLTWKIGRTVVSALSCIKLKRAKPGFINEVEQIESEFIDFTRAIGIDSHAMKSDIDEDKKSSKLKVRRRYEKFDRQAESAIKTELTTYASKNVSISETLVSIVMPTHNRAHTIIPAIESVLAQTHKRWELIVVDDGSTDSTDSLIGPFLDDSRIQFIQIEKSGVGTARNTALEASNGDIISFLDSDNDWYPDYLSLIVAAYSKYDVSVLYTGMELHTQGKTVGFRGDDFNFDACLEGNYVDLNCFSHKRGDGDPKLFNPSIKRYNDWDYILGVTKAASVKYLPFVGVRYFINSSEDQISAKEPMIYRQIVREIHQTKDVGVDKPTVVERLNNIALNIVIFVSGENKHKPSNDFYAGMSLKHAFERLGQNVSLCFFGQALEVDRVDVAISIRGSDYHLPVNGAVNLLWSIDSACDADISEISEFDLIYIASDSYRKMLELALKRRVYYLPNATDRAYFYTTNETERSGQGNKNAEILFVGRQKDISCVESLTTATLNVSFFGLDYFTDASIVGRFDELTPVQQRLMYAQSSAVIFGELDDYGYIPAYVFDAIASGARVYLTESTEASRLFGTDVKRYSNSNNLVELLNIPQLDHRADNIAREHGFDARASAMLSSVRNHIANLPIDSTFEAKPKDTVINVALFPQITKKGKWSSSAYIRLVQPLTSANASKKLVMTPFSSVEEFHASCTSDFDIVIVSRIAVATLAQATSLTDELAKNNIPLVVDIDDGFHLIDENHPEYDKYSVANVALSHLQNAAAQIWCATNALRMSMLNHGFSNAVTIENSVDKRLWRDDVCLSSESQRSSSLKILYMGSRTHEQDLHFLVKLLDEFQTIKPNSFDLTVIGISPELPLRPWLKIRNPDELDTEYPRFARWMSRQSGQYDVGVAPLVKSQFNDLKSDLKVLEYTALGLPVLASSSVSYSNSPLATLCGEKSEWFAALESLIEIKRNGGSDLVASKNQHHLWNNRSCDQVASIQIACLEKIILR